MLGGDVDPYFAIPVKFGRLHLLVRQRTVRRGRGRARRSAGAASAAYDYTVGICAAWEAELAIWQGDWRRARAALDRAEQITASTDEIMLELRLAALAARLEADEYGWSRDEHLAAGPASCARDRVDTRLQHAEAFLRPGSRSRSAATRRRSTGRSSSPAPNAAGSMIRSRPGRGPPSPRPPGSDTYLAAYARWREAEALLSGDVRAGKADRRPAARRRRRRGSGRAGRRSRCADDGRRPRPSGRHLARYQPGRTADDVGSGRGARAARGLTARELEVLRLLGEGRSNREIGEALFISAKTASVHVTHILQKLNVTTRVQAAVAAHRLTQPPPGLAAS